MKEKAKLGSKYIVEIKKAKKGDEVFDLDGVRFDIDYNDDEMGNNSITPVIIGEYKEREAATEIKWRPISQLPADKMTIIIRDKNDTNVIYEKWDSEGMGFIETDKGWVYVDDIPFSKPEPRYKPNSYWKVKSNDINYVIKIDSTGNYWQGINSTEKWLISSSKDIVFIEEVTFDN